MQISILGCGWLGLPLAKGLAGSYTVKGSVTTAEKLQLLRAEGIQPYCIDLPNTGAATLTDFLSGSDVLVITIPPKIRAGEGIPYADKLKVLLPHIKAAGIQKVLFTSSISVYADAPGITIVTEDTLPNPGTESGKQVLAAEQLLQSSLDFETTIVRFGGLVGGERHPVYHLAGRQNIENPHGPVNLIQRHDCVEVISKIIERNIWGEVFTAATPSAKTRQEYYTEKAQALGLPLPHFAEGTAKGKIIKGQDKLARLLGFTFK